MGGSPRPDCPYSSRQVQALVSPTCDLSPVSGGMVRSPTTPALMQQQQQPTTTVAQPWTGTAGTFGFQNEYHMHASVSDALNEYYQDKHSPPPTPMSPMDALKRLQSLTVDGTQVQPLEEEEN